AQPSWTTIGVSSIEGTVVSGNGFVNAGDTLEVIAGTLTNNGTIDINAQGSSADGIILIGEDTTFGGSGSVRFRTSGANSRVSGVVDSDAELTNALGHTIEGTGQVQVPFTNSGTVRPGLPFGILGATAGFTQAPSGTFVASIGPSFSNGRLEVVGDATLGGTLDIAVVEPSVLTNGFTHIILEADQVNGTFDTENTLLGPSGQLITRVRYSDTDVTIATRCLADVNLDSVTDAGDFFAWVNAFGLNDPLADQNLDGLVDAGDFFAWVVNFNSGCS
ncbi:MAG: GC-type dockerin domain-anchored protein, partial [Planctomycetota bacterium]